MHSERQVRSCQLRIWLSHFLFGRQSVGGKRPELAGLEILQVLTRFQPTSENRHCPQWHGCRPDSIQAGALFHFRYPKLYRSLGLVFCPQFGPCPPCRSASVTMHQPLGTQYRPNVRHHILNQVGGDAHGPACRLCLTGSEPVYGSHGLSKMSTGSLLGMVIISTRTILSQGIHAGLYRLPFQSSSDIVTSPQTVWSFYQAALLEAHIQFGRYTRLYFA